MHGVGIQVLGKGYNFWLYQVRKVIFERALKSLDVDLHTSSVIDIGSGTGFFIDLWKKSGVRKVVGTDITTSAVMNLKKNFSDSRFYQLDIGNTLTKSEEGQYDIVSALDIMFHVVDDERYTNAIQNIHALLRVGGLFLHSDIFVHRDESNMALRMPNAHLKVRSLDYVQDKLNRAGFDIIDRVPMFILMNYPVDTKSVIPKLLWHAMVLPARIFKPLGYVMGGILYPLEILLTSHLKESPTIELMICRKI